MRVLVPLPFDVSNLAHGRNLRVVHLLRGLRGRCDLTCVAANGLFAEAARGVLPGVQVVSADCTLGTQGGEDVEPAPRTRVRITGSFWARRAVSFLGYDQRLTIETARRARRSEVVLGFDMPSVVYLLAAGAYPVGRVCDLIDDPWLLRRSFPWRHRWSPAGIKSALSTRIIRDQVLGTFDALTAVAQRDADSLSWATGKQVSVVPNGVEIHGDLPEAGAREPLVVFTGGMDFPANETAACYLVRHIWPRVLRTLAPATGRARETSFKLAIVGANPTPRVQRLAGRPGVIVTGRVHDVSIWLRRARVAVAPMTSGCGIKNKVLEACAAGCPVVTTPLGAAGLPAGEGAGILVADAPADLAAQVVRLLTQPAAAGSIGAAGRRMVQDQFSWSGSAEKMMQVLQIASRKVGAPRAPGRGATPLERDWSFTPAPEPRQDQEVLIHAAS